MIFDTNIFIYADENVETALFYKEVLCTSNAKHFLPINGLMLEIYLPVK